MNRLFKIYLIISCFTVFAVEAIPKVGDSVSTLYWYLNSPDSNYYIQATLGKISVISSASDTFSLSTGGKVVVKNSAPANVNGASWLFDSVGAQWLTNLNQAKVPFPVLKAGVGNYFGYNVITRASDTDTTMLSFCYDSVNASYVGGLLKRTVADTSDSTWKIIADNCVWLSLDSSTAVNPWYLRQMTIRADSANVLSELCGYLGIDYAGLVAQGAGKAYAVGVTFNKWFSPVSVIASPKPFVALPKAEALKIGLADLLGRQVRSKAPGLKINVRGKVADKTIFLK